MKRVKHGNKLSLKHVSGFIPIIFLDFIERKIKLLTTHTVGVTVASSLKTWLPWKPSADEDSVG